MLKHAFFQRKKLLYFRTFQRKKKTLRSYKNTFRFFLHSSSSSPPSWWRAASSPASPGSAAGTAWSPAGGSLPASADRWAWWLRGPPGCPGWVGGPPPARGQEFVPASCPTRLPPPIWEQKRKSGAVRRRAPCWRRSFILVEIKDSTSSSKKNLCSPQ